MNTVPFDQIGFSKLFLDFIGEKESILSRFSAQNSFLHSSDALSKRAKEVQSRQRSKILAAIETTMHELELNAAQKASLQALSEENSLTVITGQQVGFLGGALYTMLKGWSAVATAQNLASKYSTLQFIPVFWIEDNDHDIDEISVVGMINSQGEAYSQHSSWNLKPERISAADVAYDDALQASIDEVVEALPNSEHSGTIAELITTLYKPGRKVTSAFTAILQAALGESGMLFVSAAELRKQGLFGEVALKELSKPGKTASHVEKASSALETSGYHAQAQASAVNLFLHIEGKRHKINISEAEGFFQAGEIRYSLEDLQKQAQTSPENFSPAVLLRPLVQDAIFPNAAYIAGPGEIAYLAQIQEIYHEYGIQQSATLARHSATLIDTRTIQLCEKLNVTPTFFMRRYDEVEKSIMHEQENKELSAALETTKNTIESAFAALLPHVTALDPTLVPTSDRMKNQALQGVQDLEAKIRKAQKRLEETTLGKARKAASLLFPEATLQERSLPYIYFAAKVGFSSLSATMKNLATQPPTAHYIVSLE